MFVAVIENSRSSALDVQARWEAESAEGCVFLGTGVEQAPWEAESRLCSWLMFQDRQEMRLLAGRALMEDEKGGDETRAGHRRGN